MKCIRVLRTLLLAALMAGCRHETKLTSPPEPTITGKNISFPANSPQLFFTGIEPVELHPSVKTQLSGRLIWNDEVTVRVFTPFAGRVRKIRADIGQTVEKNAPLAEVESSEFGQAQADARKAESDLKLAQRNLARCRELFAHGAAAQKEIDAAEENQAQTASEYARAASKIAVDGRTPTRWMRYLSCKARWLEQSLIRT